MQPIFRFIKDDAVGLVNAEESNNRAQYSYASHDLVVRDGDARALQARAGGDAGGDATAKGTRCDRPGGTPLSP